METGVKNAGNEIQTGAQNIGKEVEKGGQNISAAFQKGGDDTVAEVGRAYENVVQLAATSYHFIENQSDGMRRSLEEAEVRVREGKLVDAVWHVMTDPGKTAEQGAADAVMESSLLNSLAAAGAAVYGGPAGAAAYAAWYAYKATGDIEAALRAGAIAWATTAAGAEVRSLDGTGWLEASKRTVASAAIGGAAVAASGGSDEQVLAAFGKGAVLGAAREVYKGVTNKDATGKAPTKPPVAKLDPEVRAAFKTLDNGELDVTSMPKDISHVGLAYAKAEGAVIGTGEDAVVMQQLARLPYMNDMAYFHDQWMALTQAEGIEVQVTILPAIALTAATSPTMVTEPAVDQVIDAQKKKDAEGQS